MALDPLSAFAVACNVLQIIKVGTKVVKTAAEFRSAADGAIAEHAELRNIAQSLLSMSKDLQTSIATPSGSQAQVQSKAEHVLKSANHQCLELSTDFINFLSRLKVDGTRNVMLECLRLGVKSLWYKDKLDSISSALSQARDNLNLAFLIYMNSRQATLAGQAEITESTTKVQIKILDAVSVASSAMTDEIQNLTNKLDRLSIDSFHQTTTQFLTAHQAALSDLAVNLQSIMSKQYDLQSDSTQRQSLVAQQKIIDSLQFPLMNDRKDHVHMAHNDTCQWIFAKHSDDHPQTWSDFPTWLSSDDESSSIYWIHGKPGSGKSTLMRYLDENLSSQTQLFPWAEGPILRAQYFFWSAGTPLQKSLAGFLRSMCVQLFEQTPEAIPEVIQKKKWTTALLSGNYSSSMEWTQTELIDVLRSTVSVSSKSAKIFLMVDGLDEMEDERERLIDLLLALAKIPTVKICVSSRPWNIFRDSLEQYAQLRLEDFTQNDISHYVQERLQSHRRFHFIVRRDPEGAAKLVQDISQKSSGVFLWVRLVVEELRAGLSDGDNLVQLSRKLDVIPPDLNEYFQHMMNSIAAEHRQEASMILQIALNHKIIHNAAIPPLSLMDLSFIEEAEPDFAIQENYDFSQLDLGDIGVIQHRLESTARKLNSRCMGLLEYHYAAFEDELCEGTSHSELAHLSSSKKAQMEQLETPDFMSAFGGQKIERTFQFIVEFLHRSCRDFLLSVESQKLLHHHTGGCFDVTAFLRSARLVQIKALCENDYLGALTTCLANDVMSTLSLPESRAFESTAMAASLIKPDVESIAQGHGFCSHFGVIILPLKRWDQDQSSFLTLAIDYKVTSYVLANITKSAIEEKEGRPILDYVLQPVLKTNPWYRRSGHEWPDLQILRSVLDHGADPNQKYQDFTVWASFLFSLVSKTMHIETDLGDVQMRAGHFEALSLLITKGAASHLPRLEVLERCRKLSSDLINILTYDSGSATFVSQYGLREDPAKGIWESFIVLIESSTLETCPVHDILEVMRYWFGNDIDILQAQLLNRG